MNNKFAEIAFLTCIFYTGAIFWATLLSLGVPLLLFLSDPFIASCIYGSALLSALIAWVIFIFILEPTTNNKEGE
jgi:hypothetical protein